MHFRHSLKLCGFPQFALRKKVHDRMASVLENDDLLKHILQSVEHERRTLSGLISESKDKDRSKSLKSELRMIHFNRFRLMLIAKAVSRRWCRVCRHALTDPEWNDEDEECTLGNLAHLTCASELSESWPFLPMRLPLRCVLLPHYQDCTYGFIKGNRVYSVVEEYSANGLIMGTLHDLKVTRPVQGDCTDYRILDMEIEIDGMERRFDTIWTPLGMHYNLRREDVYDNTGDNTSTVVNECHQIHIGTVLHGRYFLSHDALYDSLNGNHIRRPDGLSCVYDHETGERSVN